MYAPHSTAGIESHFRGGFVGNYLGVKLTNSKNCLKSQVKQS